MKDCKEITVQVVAVSLRVIIAKNVFSGKIKYLDADVPSKSQYTRQNGNDNQCVVEVEGHNRSAARRLIFLHQCLITCQEVITNAPQRLSGLLVPCWVVHPAVTRVAEVLYVDQVLQM